MFDSLHVSDLGKQILEHLIPVHRTYAPYQMAPWIECIAVRRRNDRRRTDLLHRPFRIYQYTDRSYIDYSNA